MDDYKPNSHRFKEAQKEAAREREKKEKIVSGTVKTKENGIRKLTDVFISEDVNNVKSYIVMDVLVPAIKNTILDIITDSAKMIFGGSDRSRGSYTSSKISYRSFYDRRDDRRSSDVPRVKSRYSYDDIIISSRGEAEEVLDRMNELIDTYNIVSVADFYDLVGVKSEYTDEKYGWTNLHRASIERVRDGNGYGYLIRLPKALPID